MAKQHLSFLHYRALDLIEEASDYFVWVATAFTLAAMYLGSEYVSDQGVLETSERNALVPILYTVSTLLVWVIYFLSPKILEKSKAMARYRRTKSLAFELERKIDDFVVEARDHSEKIKFCEWEISNVSKGIGRLVDSEEGGRGWNLYEHYLHFEGEMYELLNADLKFSNDIKSVYGPVGSTSHTSARSASHDEVHHLETRTNFEYGYTSTGLARVYLNTVDGQSAILRFNNLNRATQVREKISDLISRQKKISKLSEKTQAFLESQLKDLNAHLPSQELRVQISRLIQALGEPLAKRLCRNKVDAYLELIQGFAN